MVFLTGILVGAFFIWLAIKLGLFEIFALMFNLVVAVYLGLVLGPTVQDHLPMSDMPLYTGSAAILLTAVGIFLVLFGVTFVFFTGPYNIVFPKTFDILLAGFVGFFTGLFVWSFISLLITLTPASQEESRLNKVGFNEKQKFKSVKVWCGLVHKVVGEENSELTVETAINDLVEEARSKIAQRAAEEKTSQDTDTENENKAGGQSDPNEPATIEAGIGNEPEIEQ